MKRIFITLLALLMLASGCSKKTISDNNQTDYTHPLSVGNQKLMVEIASTEAEQEQGLSGRSQLTDDQGMLFEFPNTENFYPQFWMKDMKFNLDFIWIKNNVIVGITKNVPAPASGTPTSELKVYNSPAPANEVLEVSAGWGQKHNIKIGDTVKLE